VKTNIFSLQGLGNTDSESENTGVIAIVQLEIEHIHRFVQVRKTPTENYINELLTAKWTPTTGFTYPTNKQGLGRRYK